MKIALATVLLLGGGIGGIIIHHATRKAPPAAPARAPLVAGRGALQDYHYSIELMDENIAGNVWRTYDIAPYHYNYFRPALRFEKKSNQPPPPIPFDQER